MRSADDIQKKIENLNLKASADLDRKINAQIDDALALKQNKSSANKLSIWRIIMKTKTAKFAMAAMIIVAVLTGIYQITGSIDGASIAWADVVERFHSVNYFSAVFYHKTNAQSEPEQMEIWVGKGGKARIHIDGQIVFCSDGHIQKAFDMKTGKEAEPSQMAKGMFNTFLRNLTGFSLETFLEFADGEKLVDVTAVMNEDSLISSELVMFDVKHKESPQWFRIWALRKSKLPLHIRMLDPRDGGCDDVVFDYSKEPKESFFNPVAFSTEVKTVSNTNLIPYLLWEDPTGKSIAPNEPDEASVFDFQTRTLDDQPWSLMDYRGKTILIKFWLGSDNALRRFSNAVEERFGKRDDFLMVVIVLRNPDKAHSYFKNKPHWITLRDSYDNIERIFGSVSDQSVYIIDKYGQLRKPLNVFGRFGIAAVDEALNGLVYDSHYTGLISSRINGCTEETVIQRYGNPDSMETKNQETVWRYRRFNVEKTEYIDVAVTFNQNKCVAGLRSGHNIVDAATVILRISETWWQKEIVEKIDPSLLSKPNTVFAVYLKQNNIGYPLGGDAYGAKPETFKTDKPYSRRMVPGKYNLEIELRETKSPYKLLWSQILIKNCDLPKNQGKDITF